MSFAPFLGGKRICLGKTFAEIISKVIGPSLFGMLDFTFVDPINYTKKTRNNLENISAPCVMVNATETQY